MESKRKTSWSKFAIFALPTLLIFCTVIIVPFFHGIFLTFTDWNGIGSTYHFVGFKNYLYVLKDKVFWSDMLLTLRYSLFTVLLSNLIAFLLAYALSTGIRGKRLFSVGFFTPNLIGGIVMGYIWVFVFQHILVKVGTDLKIPLLSTNWLSEPDKAFWALVIVSVWQSVGFLMLIYVAGFTGIPQELLEAASIDGSNSFQTLRHVVSPLMVSSFIICVFISLSRSFMVYDLNLSLTNGGDPYNTTEMVAMHVYVKAFSALKYGAGQAEAIVLFLIVAIISGLQVYFSKKLEVES